MKKYDDLQPRLHMIHDIKGIPFGVEEDSAIMMIIGIKKVYKNLVQIYFQSIYYLP